MKYTKPLQKEELDNILLETSYDDLLSKYPKSLLHLEDRMEYIVYFIGIKVGLTVFCFDFDNETENQDGEFSPLLYKETIGIRIAFNKIPKYQADLLMKIPVNYLVEPFEEAINDLIEKAMEERSIQKK